MGSIKGNKTSEQSYTLTESEFNYVMNINQAKGNIVQEYNRVISAFLKYVASTRLGYPAEDDLQFELDFGSDKKELKIKKL